jgi:hypothetical protein
MKGWIWDFYTVERWRSAGNAVVVKIKEWIINNIIIDDNIPI